MYVLYFDQIHPLSYCPSLLLIFSELHYAIFMQDIMYFGNIHTVTLSIPPSPSPLNPTFAFDVLYLQIYIKCVFITIYKYITRM
jgi:hypothetical protein